MLLRRCLGSPTLLHPGLGYAACDGLRIPMATLRLPVLQSAVRMGFRYQGMLRWNSFIA